MGAVATWFREQQAVRAWARAFLIEDPSSADDRPVAVELQRLLPRVAPAAAWHRFVVAGLATLAALLLAAALVCFVAYNWDALSKFARLYFLQALVAIGGFVGAWRVGTTLSRAAFLFAAIATGALFALIGQTYQTGADPWELFALWAALTVPFAVAARWWAIWALAIAIGNLALHRWLQVDAFDVLFSPTVGMFLIPALANALVLVAWEIVARGLRSGARLVLFAALAPLTIGAWLAIVDGADGHRATLLLAWLFGAGGAAGFYRYVRTDLVALAMLGMSVVSVVTVLAARALIDGDAGPFGWLVLAIVVVGATSVLANAIMKLRRRLATNAEVAHG